MKRSPSRTAAFAISDLTALAASKRFRDVVEELRRYPDGLYAVCHDFW